MDLLARLLRGAGQQRRDVLELVAESEPAARLVEAGPPPHPARQRLIEEPAIDHQVEGQVGRPDLDCAEQPVPRPGALAQRRLRSFRLSVKADQTGRGLPAVGLAEQENNVARLSRRQIDGGLEGRARVEGGAAPAGEARAPKSGGVGQVAVSARNSRRSAVHDRSDPLARANAAREAKSALNGFRAKIACRSASGSVTTNLALAERSEPRTHSA